MSQIEINKWLIVTLIHFHREGDREKLDDLCNDIEREYDWVKTMLGGSDSNVGMSLL